MTKELRVYGASDDLIEFAGAHREEYNAESGVFDVLGEKSDGVRVHVECTGAGTWSVGVSQIDEDFPLPDWNIRVRQGTTAEAYYSAVLVMDVPDNVRVLERAVSL